MGITHGVAHCPCCHIRVLGSCFLRGHRQSGRGGHNPHAQAQAQGGGRRLRLPALSRGSTAPVGPPGRSGSWGGDARPRVSVLACQVNRARLWRGTDAEARRKCPLRFSLLSEPSAPGPGSGPRRLLRRVRRPWPLAGRWLLLQGHRSCPVRWGATSTAHSTPSPRGGAVCGWDVQGVEFDLKWHRMDSPRARAFSGIAELTGISRALPWPGGLSLSQEDPSGRDGPEADKAASGEVDAGGGAAWEPRPCWAGR